ncbi:tetratricopeptide repeat protein [Actomonas aquatica]|uniref:Tetratricopeptide repeat protein n=1 Tax=Actomonas aquatica TaxID=2866162 RepID=A0ABZ1C8R9_9BACT|nr:hypothetical protein [Opitutus sp. WL0086]WRQ88091.1 hypothetical protein K1X11_001645 [Opitutus sp. WL0086]
MRPYWGRVIAFYGTCTVLLFSLAIFGAYGGLRLIGFPVTLKMIVWPPNWSQIDEARAAYYLEQAETAYQTGDLNAAVMSLSLAYEYDPGNYEAGLSLAKLWQATRPDVSNHLYEQLMNDHPEQRARTARTWLRALLPRADYGAIEKLSARALAFDPEMVAAWSHALLFANERTGNTDLLTRILQQTEAMQPGVREVLTLETEVRARPAAFSIELLGHPPPPDVPSFVIYYQLRRLIELGDPARAVELLNQLNDRLGDRDRISLQLQAFARANARANQLGLFDRLTRLDPSLVQVELLCAHLIVNPDEELYQMVRNRVDPMKLSAPGERLSALVAMFALSGAQGDFPRQSRLGDILRQEAGTSFKALDAITAMMRSPRQVRIERVLPSLQPLSLEMTYALLERFEMPRQ